jgi:L-seryl-tRNA(Ser) seleniumtransferase
VALTLLRTWYLVLGTWYSERVTMSMMDKSKRTTSADGAASSLPGTLRGLPSVDRVLAHPAIVALRERGNLPQSVVTMAVREELDAIRRSLFGGETESSDATLTLDEIAERASARALDIVAPSIKPVINATGVIIHTNLGRAPLSRAALDAIQQAAGYSNLEYDLEAGERGSRYDHAVQILRRVTGCEDALVVNNNAAALVLVLSALASGREAILSRGQSVEIGGGFRIPEIMRAGGVRLVEVGTTNRTYTRDYADALTADTAIIMRVHASNFRITGFTATPALEELADLAHAHNVVMLDDIGSGALLDTTRYGLSPEPMVQTSLKAGADLVLFSGDKLLGGPQCGVIVGRTSLVSRLKKHPLTRALRVDKITLAALEATLLHYLKGEAEREIPVWRMISVEEDELKRKAESWADRLTARGVNCSVEPGRSTIGGGSLPGETLPTWLVSISVLRPPPPSSSATVEQAAGELAERMRHADVPVIARVERGRLLLDPRTVLEGEEEALMKVLSTKYQVPSTKYDVN